MSAKSSEALKNEVLQEVSLPDKDRLLKLRTDILDAPYGVCCSKSSLITEFFSKNSNTKSLKSRLFAIHYYLYKKGLQDSRNDIPQKKWQVVLNNLTNRLFLKLENLSKEQAQIEFARSLDYIFQNAELKVYDNELIVGNPSSRRVGAPLHADLGGLLMQPELDELSTRKNNPMAVSSIQMEDLTGRIFPYWFNRSVLARTPLYSNNKDLFNTLLDGRFFVLTQFAGVSHVTPDYPTILRLGFNGLRKEIATKRAEVDTRLANTEKLTKDEQRDLQSRKSFYVAADIAAEAAIGFGTRWSRHLADLAEMEPDLERRDELRKLAEIFKKIPAEPATNFYEAIQSVFAVHTMLHQESFQHGISFGRMDRYLYPYYRDDLESGKITRMEAIELLGCFIAKAGELLPLFFERATEYFSGLSSASGITLGGSNERGEDETNEMSELILLAYDRVRLRQPNFHVRLHSNTKKEFRDLCYRTLKKGGGIPAFFNDEKIVLALRKLGVGKNDAWDYSVVGCVEWGVPGKSFPAAGAVFVNMPMALMLALNNGKFKDVQFGPKTGKADEIDSNESLIKAFRIQLKNLIGKAVEGNNAIETTHARHRPTTLLSIAVDGCIDKGKEINSGGAKYNSTGCQGVGFADVVDSLTVIEEMVFAKKKISLSRLLELLENDFDGEAVLLSQIREKSSKYGENRELADKFAALVSEIYADTVLQFENPRGGKYWPGFWSMTTHHGFGYRMPATPNGRLAGEPFANGCSPCNGADKFGPTASLCSATSLDGEKIGNGYALNQKINIEFLKGKRGDKLLDNLIYGHFKNGGMQIQFNVLDKGTLIKAKKDPKKFPDLVVRVSGYSAYFKDLTDEMKDEIIARTMHFNDGDPGCSK